MLKSTKDADEINLIDIILVIWSGKWKLVIAIIISILLTHIYLSNQTKNFRAITEIRTIPTSEENNYILLNNLKIQLDEPVILLNNNNKKIVESSLANKSDMYFDVTKLKLLDYYIEVLNQKKIFEDAIKKFNLLDKNQYQNEKKFNEAVVRLASSINITNPKPIKSSNSRIQSRDNNKKNKVSYNSIANIEFSFNDAEKWKNVLIYVDKVANKIVKQNFQNEFDAYTLILEQNNKDRVLDISTKISNLITDYDRNISDRISYLKEQSAIAKKLGIAKNTIEVQTFVFQNKKLSNANVDTPFYLRGFDAIDKEIELINSRTNIKPFIKGLLELEQKKRELQQDKTLERLQSIYNLSPLGVDKNFSAVSTKVYATKFEYRNNNKLFIIAAILGFILGLFYVYISNELQLRKISRKK